MTVLKDLLLDSRDGEWGAGEAGIDTTEMLVIRGTDFADVRVGDLSGVPRRHIQDRHATRKRLLPWDLLIETAGGSKDRPTGRTVLLNAKLFAAVEQQITCASFARFLRIDPERAEPAYIFWLLQHMYSTGIMRAYHTQHTGVARFQYTTFAETEKLHLPSRPVQRRIADILSAYDDLIENNTKRIKILEEMARSLYREWFVNFRFPGHEKVKMVNSPLGKVPEGWELVELGALVDDFRDSVDPAELAPDTPYFGLEHLPRRSLALGDWGRAADVQSTKLRVKTMDILFGKIRPYFHKVGPSPVDGVCSSDTIVLRVRVAEHYGVVLAATSSDEFVSHATQTSQGTKMPRASWDVLRRYAVSLPPPALLRRFNAVLTDIVTLIHALLFQNRNLSATRDLLLPRLISGEVEVEPHA